MYKLLACFLSSVLFSVACLAETNHEVVGVHLLSVHDKAGFRTVTPGVYCKMANGFTAGVLNNSEGRLGVYAGKTFEDSSKTVGLTVGVITGYSAPVTPLIVPSVYVKSTGIRLSWLSKPPNTNGASALHISYEKAF